MYSQIPVTYPPHGFLSRYWRARWKLSWSPKPRSLLYVAIASLGYACFLAKPGSLLAAHDFSSQYPLTNQSGFPSLSLERPPSIGGTNTSVASVDPKPPVTKTPEIVFSWTPGNESSPFNKLVCQELQHMPRQGGYAAGASAMQHLQQSIISDPKGSLKVDPSKATPSFCSAATYLVFLKAILKSVDSDRKSLDPDVVAKLLVRGQPDGVGVWGRWNANGPGTAVLVKELRIGENFLEWEKARSGDFLKIWWSEEIGAKEHGHSVVFSEIYTNAAGVEMLKFWSSNMPGGYGFKEVPKSKAKHLLFSRIKNPPEIQKIAKMPSKSDFLASMMSKSVTMDDVKKNLEIK